MKVNSKELRVNGDVHKAFARISNFAALSGVLPSQVPQVQDFATTEDTCSFKVAGMEIKMRITQKIEPTMVVLSSDEGTPFNFTLAVLFTPEGPMCFRSRVEAELGVNMMMGALLKGQAQKFADMLNEQIKNYTEANPA